MKLGTLFAAGLLGVTAATAAVALGGVAGLPGAAFAQQTATQTATAPGISADAGLDAAGVLALMADRGFSGITEIEREDGGWEVKAVSPDGNRVEVYLTAAGEILKTERD